MVVKSSWPVLVMTLVSLSKTLNYNCFSSPRGKRVPVRAEVVHIWQHRLYNPKGAEMIGPVSD